MARRPFLSRCFALHGVRCQPARCSAREERHTRDEQLIMDLVNIPDPDKLRGRYQGVCW
jgi:hypothetical protein